MPAALPPLVSYMPGPLAMPPEIISSTTKYWFAEGQGKNVAEAPATTAASIFTRLFEKAALSQKATVTERVLPSVGMGLEIPTICRLRGLATIWVGLMVGVGVRVGGGVPPVIVGVGVSVGVGVLV